MRITKILMIVSCLSVSLCIAPCTMLYPQNFGFSSDSQSILTSDVDGFDFSLLSREYLWLDAESDQLSFYGQASYRITQDELYFFDLDHCYLTSQLLHSDDSSTLIEIAAGRFPVSDFTSYVLLHMLDGIKIGYSTSMYAVSAYVGYSGLLWDNLLTSIEMSRADNADKNLLDLHLQPPRLIAILDIALLEFLPTHTLRISYIFQQDLRDSSTLIPENTLTYDPVRGGSFDSQYIGLGIKGAPASFFFYDLFYYFGTGSTLSYIGNPALSNGIYQYKPILSALFGGSMRFYFESALFSRIELKGLYASGDSDYTTSLEGNTSGSANQFVPISHYALGIAFSPDISNIFLFELDYSLKPFSGTKVSFLEDLQTLVKGIVFFRSQAAPISLGGINPGSGSLYLGTELDAIVNYRPLSDVGFALKYGLFIPDNGSDQSAFLPDQMGMINVLRIELSISM
jgi:hypothetical protein